MQNDKEYWVNVYGLDEYKAYGISHKSIKDADAGSKLSDTCAYRIHVKMDGGWNRYMQYAVPTREEAEIVVEELWQVPKDLPVGTKVRITGPKFYNWRDIYK